MNAIVANPESGIDPRELRDVLGCFATGVCVVTSVGDEGRPVGMTINSFSSVSLDPPLILWSIGLSAPSRQAYDSHGCFAINIMGEDAKDTTMNFARPSDDKFAGIDWKPGHNGVPVLNEAMAVLECTVEDQIISGDHEIFIGRVVQLDQNAGDPLLFHKGQFAALGAAI
ncbi:flavin reductase family protein [Rhodobacteraceae bacterium]|nr:flavin reductase family protein [Paracoccaceae bacterium]